MTKGGSLLPIGGLDHGHKGFALGLLVEVLTQGLSGYGRAESPKEWGAAVTVLAFDPARFASAEAFRREVDWLADACLASSPREAGAPVRLPGGMALARKRAAEADGLQLYPGIEDRLASLALRWRVPLPPLGRQCR